MLRDLIDTAMLEDFVAGLARAAGLRVCAYDVGGRLITASPATTAFARLADHLPGALAQRPELVALPAYAPPATVAFVEINGVWYVFAPILLEEQQIGLVAVGAFREGKLMHARCATLAAAARTDEATLRAAWEALPELKRTGDAHAVTTARWAARRLANWCHREERILTAAAETALVGDIAELLSGEHDLQTILDQIVADTAQVMRCRYCSLRLYDPKTGELTIKAVHNLSERYLNKGAVLRSESPIDDEALTGKLVYVQDCASDSRLQFPQQMRQEGIVSQLTAGMLYHGQPIGVIRLYTDRRQRFRPAQRNLLRAVAHQAAIAIVHAQLIEERLRSAETERQLALAGEVQARMMRIPPPELPGLAAASTYLPCWHLGGDFCEVFTLFDGRLAAVVADVVGKGIPASILSASILGALRSSAESCCNLGELLTRLNRQVCRETLPSEFATLLLIAVDAQSRTLTYSSAGHEPLLLLRAGAVQRLESGGMVLGFSPDETYQEHRVPLSPDDLLLLYTDGAVEAVSFTDELFGRRRLEDSLRRYGDLEVDQVLHNIVWDIRRFVGLAEQSDDLTMVAVRVLGK